MNKKIPETSLVAYRMMSCDLKQNHWNKIMMALKLLAVPSSMQKIAEKADLPYVSVARRMAELELDGLIEKAGKGLTQNNRPCALYRLVKQDALSQFNLPENIEHTNQLELFV